MNALNGRAILFVGDKMIGHMDPSDYQDMTFRLDFPSDLCTQVLIACVYLARLQRAPEGADESTSGRRDNVVNSCRMRLDYFFRSNTIMLRDCAVDSEMNRL
jgi:hypothetical protein